jgi:hypothetical protein
MLVKVHWASPLYLLWWPGGWGGGRGSSSSSSLGPVGLVDSNEDQRLPEVSQSGLVLYFIPIVVGRGGVQQQPGPSGPCGQ